MLLEYERKISLDEYFKHFEGSGLNELLESENWRYDYV